MANLHDEQTALAFPWMACFEPARHSPAHVRPLVFDQGQAGRALPHPFEIAEALLFHPTAEITAHGAMAGLILQVLAEWPHLGNRTIRLIAPEFDSLPEIASLPGEARIIFVLTDDTKPAAAAAALALAEHQNCTVKDQRQWRSKLVSALMGLTGPLTSRECAGLAMT